MGERKENKMIIFLFILKLLLLTYLISQSIKKAIQLIIFFLQPKRNSTFYFVIVSIL